MHCNICGNENLRFRLFSQMICKDCINEISSTNVEDEGYEFYKNLIRILLGYYISDIHQLNPVN